MTDGDPSASGSDAADRLMMLSTTRVGSTTLVTVEGELDLHTARELTAAIDDVLAAPDIDAVVLDLSAVSYLGSSGLGTLAELATRPLGSGRPVPVRLVAPPDNRAVMRPWDVMNLGPILPLFPDLASALSY